ncbi:hypothetical protein LCI18_002302 [Fusarium solani-melongenae]|uniref:Uncharacterized protein n=1 Tax=Fusarium solani subsp. cucurbitae TaxID=2747967 RepID=A0ACD3YQT2_FUSSC|nr:hypothetical protein LCI18_002302 [Fusarium solani-melongenae]
MPSETTSQVRRDHTRWECTRTTSTGTCGMVNDMTRSTCEAPTCDSQRQAGDFALNNSSEQIGKLSSVDNQGTEYWAYYERLVNGTH